MLILFALFHTRTRARAHAHTQVEEDILERVLLKATDYGKVRLNQIISNNDCTQNIGKEERRAPQGDGLRRNIWSVRLNYVGQRDFATRPYHVSCPKSLLSPSFLPSLSPSLASLSPLSFSISSSLFLLPPIPLALPLPLHPLFPPLLSLSLSLPPSLSPSPLPLSLRSPPPAALGPARPGPRGPPEPAGDVKYYVYNIMYRIHNII